MQAVATAFPRAEVEVAEVEVKVQVKDQTTDDYRSRLTSLLRRV